MSNKLVKSEGCQGYYPSLFNRFFSDDFMNFVADNDNLPATNVKEKRKYYQIEVSAPGFEKDDFNVWVDGDVLKITGNDEKRREDRDEDENILRQEFVSSSFSRSFVLPNNVDTSNIEAKEKNGILTIKLPKDENAVEDVIKSIEIQ